MFKAPTLSLVEDLTATHPSRKGSNRVKDDKTNVALDDACLERLQLLQKSGRAVDGVHGHLQHERTGKEGEDIREKTNATKGYKERNTNGSAAEVRAAQYGSKSREVPLRQQKIKTQLQCLSPFASVDTVSIRVPSLSYR